jgi:acetyl esterase/lipase
MMNKLILVVGIGFLAIGCDVLQSISGSTPIPQKASNIGINANKQVTLTDAKRGFQTKIIQQKTPGKVVPEPPAQLARIAYYNTPAGELAAYLTKPPSENQRFPAIIWISGGDSNTIDDGFFQDAPASNDQTASAFRKAGIVMMYPSLRGGNNNPGTKEGFFGEVDDIIAAADYLAKQKFVDPKRIYLGGHSTGGTLALLVAESTRRFRAIFSFGPVEDVSGYDTNYLPFDTSNKKELELRAPGRWIQSIQSPVFVFEGNEQPSNLDSLESLSRMSHNPLVQFRAVKGTNHFSILAPVTQLVAAKILRDHKDSTSTNVSFTEAELNKLFAK